MATRTPAVTYAPNGHRQIVQCVWSGLATGDDGAPVELPGYADRSVQVDGTFGGATVAIQVSNTGSTWFPATDPQGNAISFTAGGLEQLEEVARHTRCVVTGGAGSGITVNMLGRRTP